MIALLALIIPLAANSTELPRTALPVEMRQSGGQDLFGDGARFHIRIEGSGAVTLRATSWLCSDGVHHGTLNPSDVVLLNELLATLQGFSDLPCCCGSPHDASFRVELASVQWSGGTCVELIPGSAFESIFTALPLFLRRASWHSLTPAQPPSHKTRRSFSPPSRGALPPTSRDSLSSRSLPTAPNPSLQRTRFARR